MTIGVLIGQSCRTAGKMRGDDGDTRVNKLIALIGKTRQEPAPACRRKWEKFCKRIYLSHSVRSGSGSRRNEQKKDRNPKSRGSGTLNVNKTHVAYSSSSNQRRRVWWPRQRQQNFSCQSPCSFPYQSNVDYDLTWPTKINAWFIAFHTHEDSSRNQD